MKRYGSKGVISEPLFVSSATQFNAVLRDVKLSSPCMISVSLHRLSKLMLFIPRSRCVSTIILMCYSQLKQNY